MLDRECLVIQTLFYHKTYSIKKPFEKQIIKSPCSDPGFEHPSGYKLQMTYKYTNICIFVFTRNSYTLCSDPGFEHVEHGGLWKTFLKTSKIMLKY